MFSDQREQNVITRSENSSLNHEGYFPCKWRIFGCLIHPPLGREKRLLEIRMH